MNIFVYTKRNCPNCVSAKALLKLKGLHFVECDMDDPAVRAAFQFAYPDIRSLPQIFIDDQRVGGLAGLKAALKQLEENNG
jgi:glutaredoxin 3